MGANSSDADLLQSVGRGRGRGRGGSALIKQRPNDAGYVVLGDFYFDAATNNAYTLDAEAGGFTLTGVSAAIVRAYTLNADAGNYSLTGANAAILHGTVLFAEAGSFTLSGNDATIAVAHTIDCAPGSFAITGGDAEIVYSGDVQPPQPPAPPSGSGGAYNPRLNLNPYHWPIYAPVHPHRPRKRRQNDILFLGR